MRLAHSPLFVLIFALITCASSMAWADSPVRQAGNFGAGIGGGQGPYGLSLKYFMSEGQAVQGVVGFSFGGKYIGANLDYLIELPEFVQTELINIGPSVGVGAGLGIWNNGISASLNGVAGLEFMLNPVPIDFVVEWRPSLNVVPDPSLRLVGFTGHVRYYF